MTEHDSIYTTLLSYIPSFPSIILHPSSSCRLPASLHLSPFTTYSTSITFLIRFSHQPALHLPPLTHRPLRVTRHSLPHHTVQKVVSSCAELWAAGLLRAADFLFINWFVKIWEYASSVIRLAPISDLKTLCENIVLRPSLFLFCAYMVHISDLMCLMNWPHRKPGSGSIQAKINCTHGSEGGRNMASNGPSSSILPRLIRPQSQTDIKTI